MIKKLIFWLNCSRAFALPLTVLSWLTVFLFSLKSFGNLLNGLIALVGISFAHLAGNLADDYIDYGILSRDEKMMASAVETKCCFIRDGSVSLQTMLKAIAICSVIALLSGAILFFRSGTGVVWLTAVAGILTLTYARFSLVGLSEVVIGLLFGPLMFEGVYYVMTKTFSFKVFVLSIAVVMFTIGFLYIHTLLDFDSDKTSHKRTLCCRIGDKEKALKLFAGFCTIGYSAAFYFGYLTENIYVLLTYLTIPYAVKVYDLMKQYNDCNESDTERFYFVLFKARNLMVMFCILLSAAILIS